MKRMIKFILIAMSIFSFSAIDTQAATEDITWTINNLYADYYALFGELYVPDAAYGIELFIPETDNHTFSNGGVSSFIEFRDVSNNLLLSLNTIDIKTDSTAGLYELNFISLNIEDVYLIKIQITQAFDTIPGGYLDYINANDDLMFNYDYNIELIWNNINLYANYYSIQTNFSVITDARLISFYIPPSQYHTSEIGDVEDEINFYDINGNVLLTERLINFNFNLISGLYKLDVEEDLNLQIGQISYITIIIPQTYETLPSQYLDFLNTESVVSFNDRVFRVNYYLKGELYLSELFNFTPDAPTDPLLLQGEYFEGWFLANGTEYNFDIVITDDLLFNNELNLYAKITDRAPIDTDLGDPEPSEFFGTIFDTLGMNSTTGYAIMYLIVIILSLVGLRSVNLPNIMIVITMILITALFMFMGFLPVLMGIIAFGVFALILFSGGGL